MTPSEGVVETLDRLFNALWREGFARRRRISRHCALGRVAVVALADGSEVLAGLRAVRAMDRLRTRPPYYVRREGRLEPITAIEDLGEVLSRLGGDGARLVEEAAQSAANMDHYLDIGRLRFRGGPRWLAGELAKPAARVAPEAALESWVARGHTLHPCAKTRMGFSGEDVKRYSPEYGEDIPLRFAAVRRAHVVETRAGDGSAGLPAPWQWALDKEMAERRLDRERFAVLPVHPWQWEHTLPRVFAGEIGDGVVVPLKSVAAARPLVSVRTLVPSGMAGAYHIKVPIAVLTTSAVRTVSAQSAQNGPRLSAALTRWQQADPGLAPGLDLQPEELGAHYWDPGKDPRDPAALERARHLSALFRRPPARRPGTQLVPAALLSEVSPAGGCPVACEVAENCGLKPLEFFHSYARALFAALMGPLVRRGVALEAHAQNTLLRLAPGGVAGIVLRDLGGLRIHTPWCRDGQLLLHPASVITAGTPEEMIAKAHHTWLQGSLGPVASVLAECAGQSEEVYWAAARGEARSAFERAAAGVSAARRRAAEAVLFAPRMRLKALTRMRLGGRSHEYDFFEVANPLA